MRVVSNFGFGPEREEKPSPFCHFQEPALFRAGKLYCTFVKAGEVVLLSNVQCVRPEVLWLFVSRGHISKYDLVFYGVRRNAHVHQDFWTWIFLQARFVDVDFFLQ